jgi:hypothetical protein
MVDSNGQAAKEAADLVAILASRAQEAVNRALAAGTNEAWKEATAAAATATDAVYVISESLSRSQQAAEAAQMAHKAANAAQAAAGRARVLDYEAQQITSIVETALGADTAESWRDAAQAVKELSGMAETSRESQQPPPIPPPAGPPADLDRLPPPPMTR